MMIQQENKGGSVADEASGEKYMDHTFYTNEFEKILRHTVLKSKNFFSLFFFWYFIKVKRDRHSNMSVN